MNAFEQKIADGYKAQGWTVLRDGWPDFLCYRKNPDGTITLKAVEVKAKGDQLRPNQMLNLAVLSTVMEVREVREGHGYGHDAPVAGAYELIYDRERFEHYEGGEV